MSLDLTKPLMIVDRDGRPAISNGKPIEVFNARKTNGVSCEATAGIIAQTPITFRINGWITSTTWSGYKVENYPPLGDQIKAWERKTRRELQDHDEQEAMEASPLWGAW